MKNRQFYARKGGLNHTKGNVGISLQNSRIQEKN
jgi:hypothetical protein